MEFQKQKNIVSLILFVFLIYSVISIFYITFGKTNLSSLSTILYTSGRFFGLLGFLAIAFLVISGDLGRFFDRFFGIDRIIKFQRKFAIFTYFLVFSHPIFFILSNSSYLNFLLPDFSIAPLAAGTIGLYLFAAIMVSSLNYKKISHNVWQYLHIVTYALFFIVSFHAINYGTSYLISSNIRFIFSLLSILVLIGIVYRTRYKILHRYKLKVSKIKWETKDTFSLFLESPKKIKFKSGQFFFLRIPKNKLYSRHPFSVSSSSNEKDLRFTIKLEGRFTETASKLKKDDFIYLEGPFGNFTIKDDKKDLVFIAGGVGITPFIPMIKQFKNKNITLFYASKRKKDIILKKELDSLKRKNLKVIYFLNNETNPGKGYETGYINKNIIKKYIKTPTEKTYYICGPEKMKESCFKILKELDVKNSQIFYESFFW